MEFLTQSKALGPCPISLTPPSLSVEDSKEFLWYFLEYLQPQEEEKCDFVYNVEAPVKYLLNIWTKFQILEVSASKNKFRCPIEELNRRIERHCIC